MLALVASACRDAHPRTSEGGRSLIDSEPVEDSGRRLAGNFVAQSLTDDYAANSVQAAPLWAFSFKEDGSFRSERPSRGAVRVEQGSYLISPRGELVLYIEAAGGDALTEARLERYKIEGESDTELKLRRNGSATLVLHKR